MMKLLLVEDNLHLLDAFCEWIELEDHLDIDLYTAQNGLQALQVLRSHAILPHVILSDYAMPEMDGLQFLQALRQEPQWCQIPFIFLTANGDMKNLQSGRALGVDDFIAKPFAMDHLIAHLHARYGAGYQAAS